MIDIRIICPPEEADAAEAALRSAFDHLSGFRRYAARGGGVRLYCSGAPREERNAAEKDPEPVVFDHEKMADLRIKPAPIEGKNHLLILASVPAPEYVSFFYAKRLNDAIQRDIRDVIGVDSDIRDIYIRMDQTAKPYDPGFVLYNSGSDWQEIFIDDMGRSGYL